MRLTKDLKTPHDDTTYADDLINVVDRENIVLTKLKHYEDIEEKLGIDLITLFKALEIIKENLNIDEILLAVKGICKASDYDLLKKVLL